MQHPVDLTKSLEQLEQSVWPHDPFPTRVVQESQRLRKVPLYRLTTEDLRLLIGQKIGLPFLVPLALDQLESNLFAEGAMYKGDLLVNVLTVPKEFWESQPALGNRLVDLNSQAKQVLELLSSELLPAFERLLCQ